MKKVFIFFLLIFSLILGGCVSKTSQEKPQPSKNVPSEQRQSADSNVNRNQNQEQSSDLIQYTNETLGFSIKIPQRSIVESASCQAIEKDGKRLYQPKFGSVPVKVFADNDNGKVYIDHEYFYEPSGDTVENENGLLYSKCDKIENNLVLVKNNGLPYTHYAKGWAIQVKEVKNEQALTQFIQERYGAACNLGEKKLLADSDIYEVTIKGDGKEPPESKCYINSQIYIRYSPTKNKVAAWDGGQDYYFRSTDCQSAVDSACDQSMADSFQFVE